MAPLLPASRAILSSARWTGGFPLLRAVQNPPWMAIGVGRAILSLDRTKRANVAGGERLKGHPWRPQRALLSPATGLAEAASTSGAAVTSQRSSRRSPAMAYHAVHFEVFGKVQGVFFRKYTAEKATSLGLVGWCRNTERGTVEGELQGPPEAVQEMKKWLSTVGSPASVISKFEVKKEDLDLETPTYTAFSIRR